MGKSINCEAGSVREPLDDIIGLPGGDSRDL